MKPEVTDMGFRDASEHRADLPGTYNIYADTSVDAGYRAEDQDLQILYRPLFITSVMLEDFLADNDFFGANTVLVSSASSKTAYAMAFCTGRRESRPRLIGLTSPRNVAFTETLGCYDEVVTYDEVTGLHGTVPTLYVDVSGNPKLRATIHEHFENLVHDAAVGITHDDARLGDDGDLRGPKPQFFFAPDQIRKRREDWGPNGIGEHYRAAWFDFVPAVENWVDVRVGKGRDGLLVAWLEVLGGRVDPRMGDVIAL